jgi:hypothetical protein
MTFVLLSLMAGQTAGLREAAAATLWPVTTAPGVVDSGPDSAVELGVKFRADTSGTVTGIRFYKASTNSGTHVGNLWSSSGALLASATFTGETASGWQQVNFTTPVAISANTVYVASYHTNTGHYSFGLNYFTGKGVDAAPLHAPADGVSGYNGVYAYGSASKFPNQGWKGSNYWVDVVFSATTTPDTIPPVVNTFTVPATASSLTVAITALTATDNVAVSGYLVNEAATTPLPGATGWQATAPVSYTFATAGTKTLYAWAKDGAGNVSASLAAPVTVTVASAGPEPAGWYAGDMHVHRSCGGTAEPVATMFQKMVPQNLAVVSMQADMGNGEVQDPALDLPRVTGADDPLSTATRIFHWDAEWHWDAVYTQYPHQALGGHVVTLGLTEAHQIWQEYTYPIFDWAHQQNGIAGFAHMQYLDDGIPQTLNCCIPIEYPVEVALGASDFISEDVGGSDTAVNAYYRLLNCGFRPGFAAGTDYPCNSGADLGSLLTYVQVAGGELSYRNWIDGIAKGRTVVSRNGHNEFLELKVNGTAAPGDEIRLATPGTVQATITWTAKTALSGTVELVHNGAVVASKTAAAAPGTPVVLTATVDISRSGWLAARRMGANGHQTHTGALFVLVNGAPIRASEEDAQFYVQWMDNLLTRTAPGGSWSDYFTLARDAARARYQAAKELYQQIALEAAPVPASLTIATTALPAGQPDVAYSGTVAASGGVQPYSWSISSGALPPGIALNSATGALSGTPTIAGSYPFTVMVADSGTTRQSATAQLAITIAAGTGTVFSLWPATAIPGTVDAGPDSAVELGVRFTSEVSGTITGIRFYKASTNSGTHVGNLWSSSGTLLATATFANESASGWQQVLFATPVAIAANTPYIASYHTNSGHYSFGSGYFTGKGVDAPPLHAPADATAAANGLFAYGTASRFPSQGWKGSNYWVDVLFSAVLPPDTTAPNVTAFTVPAAATTLTVAITGFTASDNVAVTGYLVTESALAPDASASGWSATTPAIYTFTSAGSKTLYAWARDGAGNVSTSRNAGVVITLPDVTPPSVTAFTLPAVSATLEVAITSFTASDNLAVTGYLVTETAQVPDALASGWSTTPPATFSCAAAGDKTLYAWARDAAGNVSAARSAAVVITLADTTRPVIATFTLPETATSLTVAISSFTASDNLGVTGYLVKESATPPTAAGSGWSATAPAYFTCSMAGTTTLYAWVKDAAGNISAVREDSVTITLPEGGAILLIKSVGNPFSNYYGEILRAEGFNSFMEVDISEVTSGVLSTYDLALLGEMPLTASQVSMLSDWVNDGGHLIAMRPDKQLAGLLGLTDQGATIANTYLLVNTASGPGSGIVGQTMQFHGPADLYGLDGAATLATLYANATTAMANPAVTLQNVGTSGGQAAAFTYDLARSVIYTRQGNPAWEGQERDGYTPIRSDDLFYGAAQNDPQPDWIDLNKVAIPQADEQQRLLANMIIQMNLDKKLLPRFWYFPRNLPALVVMTGDDHNGGGTVGRFNIYKSLSPTGCSVQDWQCIRSTSYIFASNPYITPAQAAAYENEGFEVAMHLNTNCENWTPSTLRTFFTSQRTAWSQKFTAMPAPVTSRTHCIVWSDYSSTPEIEQTIGVGLDTSYYYWPPTWVVNLPGFFTGSGIPMKFADAEGNLLNVYQGVTQMTDESGQTYPYTIDTLLARATGPEGYYGAFVANIHTDEVTSWESDDIIASAQRKGIPVISARQLLQWLNARNGATFTALDWNGSMLSFAVTANNANGLTAMAPVPAGKTAMKVSFNGTSVPFTIATIKGVRYATFAAADGTYQVTYVPIIGAVTPADGAVSIDSSAKVTVTFTEPMDVTTITTGTFVLLDQEGTAVPAAVSYNVSTMTATLTPTTVLIDATTYSATVKGGSSGVRNASGTPLPDDFTWTFTTRPEGVPPVVTAFAIPANNNSLNLPVTAFTATDNVKVTGYLLTETAAIPGLTAGWSATPPTAYLFSTAGTKTLHAWARDASGNISASRSASVVITAAAPRSIWAATAAPVTADSGPDNAVELGVKFRADSNGYLTGIRFYKATANSGTHVANLWTSSGTLLASAIFASESASGWQQVYFATPVAISANTVYVASYHTNSGHYSCDLRAFAGKGVDNAPLHALADGVSGVNGCYAYGSTSRFPNQGWNSSNYWVDVIFVPQN